MSTPTLVLVLLAIGIAGFFVVRRRALLSADGDARNLHSLPFYYGSNAFIFACIPAFLLMIVWLVLQPILINTAVSRSISDDAISAGSSRTLMMSDIRRVADGLTTAVDEGQMTEETARDMRVELTNVRDLLGEVGVALGSNVTETTLTAAQQYRLLDARYNLIMTLVVLTLAASGLTFAYLRTDRDFRARNTVETTVRGILIFASTIAILTTVGIILSLLFETINFFRQYSWTDFFFSATWSPNFRGNSDLGILPLLWGTLYISFIALLVAVPVGLFAAIYLSEYAGPRLRSIAKPAIEILAGIPTIVYGLFALVTVGPFLRDYFAQPTGFGDSASSVLTAGLVMGIMLIPFVSSLSDDIINAVPQSLRDGSLGLGATQSETIRQVIIPAALPGIVGAILLAASRAIGETMIVVLGAGAAARLSLNPFEAMTTVTVKIVSQLTGDTDFASPETLVAFALGLTLFVMTLGLNVIALVIVRKYREQYE
ncbi:phosphate ABC transporter permease subunit PstC [Aestuariibius insulae]|uniref:phosphate ABC transporter permease subunit PstC n=1 Tax=Aestuariibius insulae TaxID=2058287 RepID=UPI00345EC41D